MKQEFIMTLRKSGNSLCITVPKQIVKFLKLAEDDLLKIEIEKIKNEK
jgi:antitoxin component of MazEF toxin-antitoxin module